jgi:hypothetical protein
VPHGKKRGKGTTRPAGDDDRQQPAVVLTCGPDATVSGNSNRFEYFQIHSKFHLSKLGLPKLKIFEIKYAFEGFEERNNFLYRNFFKFEVDFE